MELRVSIPSWVFCPSRHEPICRYCRGVAEFQSRLGFSVRRDVHTLTDRMATIRFQSRLGFSVRRDRSSASGELSSSSVSIPSWVFCPSRRARNHSTTRRTASFNPVLGFLSVATWDVGTAPMRSCAFQSRLGFSVRRDGSTVSMSASAGRFQSRLGFSVRRDVFTGLDFLHVVQVSIPSWVFCPSRLRG